MKVVFMCMMLVTFASGEHDTLVSEFKDQQALAAMGLQESPALADGELEWAQGAREDSILIQEVGQEVHEVPAHVWEEPESAPTTEALATEAGKIDFKYNFDMPWEFTKVAGNRHCSPWTTAGGNSAGTTVQKCQELCSASASCVALSWFPTWRKRCYLFTSCRTQGLSSHQGQVYLKRKVPDKPEEPPASSVMTKVAGYKYCRPFTGDGANAAGTTGLKCRQLCAASGSCAGITWFPSRDFVFHNRCYLFNSCKSQGVSTRKGVVYVKKKVAFTRAAGYKYCKPWTTAGANMAGTTPAKCRQLCANSAACRGVSWFPFWGKHCYLFGSCRTLGASRAKGQVYLKKK